MSNSTVCQQPLDYSFETETIVRVHRHERDYLQIANATAQLVERQKVFRNLFERSGGRLPADFGCVVMVFVQEAL